MPSAMGPRARLMSRSVAVVVAGLALSASAASAASATSASAHRAGDRTMDVAPRVVVVAVPDLLWSDLSSTATPTMWGLLAQGAAGALSVKSSWDLAGCADGLLTLGAGNRAAAEAKSAAAVPCTDPSAAQTATLDRRLRTTAGLAALSAALRAHGVRTATIGPGAAVALPAADVVVAPGSGLAAAAGAQVVLAVDDTIYAAQRDGRAAAVVAVDRTLGALIDPLPASTTVLLVGSSDRPTPPGETGGPSEARLHVALARGPDFTPGWLSSPSTKRAPYVELIDVAPTVLRLVGAPVPASVVGRPWAATSDSATAGARRSALADLDVKAVQGAHWRPPFMWAVSLLALLVTLLGLGVANRRPGSAGRRLAEAACYVVALLPFASWLLQLLPWWRWNIGLLPALLLTLAGLGGATTTIAARRVVPRGLLIVMGLSALLLVADLVTGSRLQTAALLGDSPITAGRFYGAGNTAFGVLAAAALLGAAVACAAPADRPRPIAVRRAGLAAALLVACAAVDAAPTLGADVGGGLALTPSAVVVVLMLARVRMSVRRVAAAIAVGALPVVGLALWDYHRPAQRRTHIGQFVAQVFDGQAGHVIARKLSANLGQLVGSPFLPLVVGTVLVVVFAIRAHRPRLERTFAQTPGLRAGLAGFTLCALLGAVLNDSGVTVTGIMLSVALPAVTALALRADPIDDR
jgi:hypothetical protein